MDEFVKSKTGLPENNFSEGMLGSEFSTQPKQFLPDQDKSFSLANTKFVSSVQNVAGYPAGPKNFKKSGQETKLKGMSRMFTNLRRSCCESDRMLTKKSEPEQPEFTGTPLQNFDITSIVRNAVRESITQ